VAKDEGYQERIRSSFASGRTRRWRPPRPARAVCRIRMPASHDHIGHLYTPDTW